MQRSISNSRFRLSRLPAICAALCLLMVLTGCTMNLRNQPRYEPFEQSAFYKDKDSSRPLVADTVARDNLRIDSHFYTGQVDGEFADTYPFEITAEMLDRGQERFDIFCAPCHSRLGDGNGMVVQRGFKQPPSFHIERLQNETPGYFYGAITNGFGVMPSYASRIPPKDRWLIVAYIEALQLSQNATLNDVSQSERGALD